MDVAKVLAELRQQRDQIDLAILSLERLASGRDRGRGRPPDWMAAAPANRRGRPPGSKDRVLGANFASEDTATEPVSNSRWCTPCFAISVQRDCPECQRLWERYYFAVAAEFLWQERLEADKRLSSPQLTALQRAEAEAAFVTAAAVRAELAAHHSQHVEF